MGFNWANATDEEVRNSLIYGNIEGTGAGNYGHYTQQDIDNTRLFNQYSPEMQSTMNPWNDTYESFFNDNPLNNGGMLRKIGGIKPGKGLSTPVDPIMAGYDDWATETYGRTNFADTADMASSWYKGEETFGSSSANSRRNEYLDSIGRSDLYSKDYNADATYMNSNSGLREPEGFNDNSSGYQMPPDYGLDPTDNTPFGGSQNLTPDLRASFDPSKETADEFVARNNIDPNMGYSPEQIESIQNTPTWTNDGIYNPADSTTYTDGSLTTPVANNYPATVPQTPQDFPPGYIPGVTALPQQEPSTPVWGAPTGYNDPTSLPTYDALLNYDYSGYNPYGTPAPAAPAAPAAPTDSGNLSFGDFIGEDAMTYINGQPNYGGGYETIQDVYDDFGGEDHFSGPGGTDVTGATAEDYLLYDNPANSSGPSTGSNAYQDQSGTNVLIDNPDWLINNSDLLYGVAGPIVGAGAEAIAGINPFYDMLDAVGLVEPGDQTFDHYGGNTNFYGDVQTTSDTNYANYAEQLAEFQQNQADGMIDPNMTWSDYYNNADGAFGDGDSVTINDTVGGLLNAPGLNDPTAEDLLLYDNPIESTDVPTDPITGLPSIPNTGSDSWTDPGTGLTFHNEDYDWNNNETEGPVDRSGWTNPTVSPAPVAPEPAPWEETVVPQNEPVMPWEETVVPNDNSSWTDTTNLEDAYSDMGVDINSEQGQQLAEQDQGMFDSPEEANNFYNDFNSGGNDDGGYGDDSDDGGEGWGNDGTGYDGFNDGVFNGDSGSDDDGGYGDDSDDGGYGDDSDDGGDGWGSDDAGDDGGGGDGADGDGGG